MANIFVSNTTVLTTWITNARQTVVTERGYSHKCLKKAFNRADVNDRHNLLFSKKAKLSNKGNRIITTYTNDHGKITQICKKILASLNLKPPQWDHLYRLPLFPKVPILVLDRLHLRFRGGDFNKLLLQHELRWISNLNATSPPGLNKAFNLKLFYLASPLEASI